MNTDFQFELTTPVKYHSGGEEVEGNFITLYAPSKKQMKNNIALKEAFFKAVSKQEESTTTTKEKISEQEKLSGLDLIDMMYISGVPMHSVLLSATELFKSGVAKIDGSVSLTQPILDGISQDDLEAMTGDYMVNFTLASFLSRRED